MSEAQTHHENCWRDPKHHACAVRRIEELEDDFRVQSRNAASYCVQLSEAKDRLEELERLFTRLEAKYGPFPAELLMAEPKEGE